MIISQTPYRVSFAGGGTDIPGFYRQDFGAVLSATIDRHIYVNVHRRFEPNIRVAYSRIELADRVNAIEHDLVREALQLTGIDEPLEITTIGDVPASTGMGSSSTLTTGLLTALYAHRGQFIDRNRLAQQACEIEIDVLKKPIGRQDQYAAAFGGLNYIRFNPDDSVDVEPVPCSAETRAEFERHVLLVYTEQTRSADEILGRLGQTAAENHDILRRMRDLAAQMREALTGLGNLNQFSRLLHTGWELKRSLGCGISSGRVDELYQKARRAGAEGGKLLGAGGGGFLLLMAPPDRHRAIREVLGRPRELPFHITRHGSRIIFFHD
jgi:D-glycero-alpha-D-manno-heptose-7-phosphate kinase